VESSNFQFNTLFSLISLAREVLKNTIEMLRSCLDRKRRGLTQRLTATPPCIWFYSNPQNFPVIIPISVQKNLKFFLMIKHY